MLFLNPFDSSGLGLYSKTAKHMVERIPMLAKQRRHSVRPSVRYMAEEQGTIGGDSTLQSALIGNSTPLAIKKQSLREAEPFSKSLSRQQRILASEGKNKNPAVGAYHPRQTLNQPKLVWNIVGTYQKSVSHKKQIQERKEKLAHSVAFIRSKKNKSQIPGTQPLIPGTEPINPEIIQEHEESFRRTPNPEQIHYEKFRYRNSIPFVDMSRMLGRQSTSFRQQSCYQAVEVHHGDAFLTTEMRPLSSKRGTVQFTKQLSREKVQSLYKQNGNLVYDCNYSLVTTNNRIGPDFNKMVNREGKSVQTELHNLQNPDYSQIWLNRNKKSLPNLSAVLQRKLRKERSKRFKTEQARLQ